MTLSPDLDATGTLPDDVRLGVTAIVVTHNSARHMAALATILMAGSHVPTKMLVIDNASGDDTVARAFAVGFEIHEMGGNIGFGAGCNAGLRAATTELVLICNPDARPSRDAIERLLDVLIRQPGIAIAGPAFDDPVRMRRFTRISGDVWTFLPRALQCRLTHIARDVPVDRDSNHVVVDYTIGAFMLCRVAALRAAGGFDEGFFLYNEEEDLCRRLSDLGWKIVVVPSAVVTHEASSSSEGVNGSVMAPFRFHSLYRYYRKYHSRAYAELARFVILLCVTAHRAHHALRRRPQVYSARTAIAPFLDIGAIRRDYKRRVGGRR